MKKNVVVFALLLFTSFSFSQNNEIKKIKKVGSLYDVTIYYRSGQIMQHGFLTEDEKLHASWESLNEDGSRKCVATYNKGVKVGVWFYYYGDKKTKVTYRDNKIISVENLDSIN